MKDQYDELMSELNDQTSKKREEQEPQYVLPPVDSIPASAGQETPAAEEYEDLDALIWDTPGETDDDMKIAGHHIQTDITVESEQIDELAQTKQISLNDISAVTAETDAGSETLHPSDTDEDSEYETDDERRARRRASAGGCIKGLIYTIIVLGLSFVLSFTIIIAVKDVTGMGKSRATVDITVTAEDTPETIAEKLKEHGVIDQPWIFTMYTKLLHKDDKFKPGVFTVSPNLGYTGIVDELQTDKVRETVTVMIPEGSTIQEIAALLSDNGVCTQSDFYKAVAQGNFSEYSFIAGLTETQNRIYRLEGYLFPDTYEFYKESSAESAIFRMLDNFKNKVMNEQVQSAITAAGYSVDQVITMASLVQKEAGKIEDMPRVMRVISNRLQDPAEFPRLELDSTIDYVLSILPGASGATVVSTAYNTYEREGLPVGAICNPGMDAINAVLAPSVEPEIVNCYYFASDTKTGITYFSETFAEHEAICREYEIGAYA